jgi:hypothetical protein
MDLHTGAASTCLKHSADVMPHFLAESSALGALQQAGNCKSAGQSAKDAYIRFTDGEADAVGGWKCQSCIIACP